MHMTPVRGKPVDMRAAITVGRRAVAPTERIESMREWREIVGVSQ